MATPTENTLALVPPRRPTNEDFGGTGKLNDAKYPPNPVTQPTAEDWNEFVRMIAAAWRVNPIALIPVTFSGGTPTIGTPSCGNPDLVAGSFSKTDHGPGDTTISWAANTFPSSIVPPMAFITSSGIWFQPDPQPVSNGVRVKTYDSTSTLTDANFVLVIF